MINSFKQQDGRVGVMMWGIATMNPVVKETKNGGQMVYFFVKYGTGPKKTPTDRPEGKTIKVIGFNDVVPLCAQIEAKEPVFVCGELKENEYNGKKEYNIIADIVIAPNSQLIAVEALRLSRQKPDGAASPSESGKTSNGKGPDAFDDLDQVDIDDIFPGL